jgi:acetyl-CoA synthetase
MHSYCTHVCYDNVHTLGVSNGVLHMVVSVLCMCVCNAGAAVAVVLPLHPLAAAVYLGIVLSGCVVVSIADSFSSNEIAARLRISHAQLVFTQV